MSYFIRGTWHAFRSNSKEMASVQLLLWRESDLSKHFPNQLKMVVCWSHFQPVLYFPLVLPIIYSRQLRNMQDTRRRHKKKWLRPYLLSHKQVPLFSYFPYWVCLLMQVYQSLLSNLGTVLRNGKLRSFLYILYSVHIRASFFLCSVNNLKPAEKRESWAAKPPNDFKVVFLRKGVRGIPLLGHKATKLWYLCHHF